MRSLGRRCPNAIYLRVEYAGGVGFYSPTWHSLHASLQSLSQKEMISLWWWIMSHASTLQLFSAPHDLMEEQSLIQQVYDARCRIVMHVLRCTKPLVQYIEEFKKQQMGKLAFKSVSSDVKQHLRLQQLGNHLVYS